MNITIEKLQPLKETIYNANLLAKAYNCELCCHGVFIS